MDTARRWQIVTALTAVGGLSVGGLALGAQPSESVPAIELEPTHRTSTAVDRAPHDETDTREAEIVSPDIRTLDSPASLASPAEGASTGGSTATADEVRPPPADDEPPQTGGELSTDSVDSVGSLDSDD